tara:strand:+ start:289 stop:471 length:183 start_codon:yes stop_codon:yes gene_type:complete
MSRQPGAPMRKLLALHIKWLKINGYPVKNTQPTSEKKKKRKKEKRLQSIFNYCINYRILT